VPSVTVHWVRHGEIPSHRGDVPLTERGLARARERGRALAGELSRGEVVRFMHAPTLRTRQTAKEVRAGMAEALDPGSSVELLGVEMQHAIRNPDLYVAGQRVEMVSTPEALARQLSDPPLDAKTLSNHPFFSAFWGSEDRIGYWVRHPDPPGEDAAAVARRQLAFALSLRERQEGRPARYVLSTHSPVLRSVLLRSMGEDPGEPRYLERVDLLLAETGTVELRFRGERRCLSCVGMTGDSLTRSVRGG
jgi:broad specificity phosphatase PhoE